MNDHVSFAPATQPEGKLFLKAVGLSLLAAALGLGLSDAQGATDEAASAPPAATSRTERVVSDSWITTKVKSEILKSSLATGFDVKVTTLHGIVTLRGTLASAAAIDQVKAVAAKVKGVHGVDASPLVAAAR
jgi:hyperosmotically inducible protein